MAKNAKKSSGPKPERLSFPDDETRFDWLPMLLDAYYIADKGVHDGIKLRLNQGQKLACAKGCSTCCSTHITIPVYPLELSGIYWYTMEKTENDRRKALKEQLSNFTENDPCPFLIKGICGIHPMRPLACRHFNVFHKPCDENEDPYFTRRNDVLTPIKKYKEKALAAMLPFHKITQRSEKIKAMKTGLIHTYAKNLQEVEWIKLAERLYIMAS